MSGLSAVAEVLRAEGGLLAQALAPQAVIAATPTPLGTQVATGPRATGREEELALVIEAVHEGSLLHAGRARVLATEDRDLELLAGDRLYALGLARLADAGDLHAVGVLADTIALCARAQAMEDPALADAAWHAGVAALGAGPEPRLEQAFRAAKAGEKDAAERLDAAARHVTQAWG